MCQRAPSGCMRHKKSAQQNRLAHRYIDHSDTTVDNNEKANVINVVNVKEPRYGAFISGLRPGRLFKYLIARPPSSMEELFTLVNSFVKAEEANIKNRLCESKLEPIDSRHGQNSRDQHKRHKDKYAPRTGYRPNNHNNPQKPTFTPLLKSPAEIYATTEGKAALRPPQRMFTPPHRRDRTRYCEFHGDHGHDKNCCVDLRKEIEACIRNGRLSHLAKGARGHNTMNQHEKIVVEKIP
nr:reverse transcriptase domain-containing protein [Tanacetum cinerariifolium]